MLNYILIVKGLKIVKLTQKEEDEFYRALIKERRFKAWFDILTGIFIIGLFTLLVLASFDMSQIIWIILVLIFFGGIGFLLICAGVRVLRANPFKRTRDERLSLIRKVTKCILAVLIIYILFKVIYIMNTCHGRIEINNDSQFWLTGYGSSAGIFKSESDGIYIKSLNIELTCSEKDTREISTLQSSSRGNTVYVLEYEWNKLFGGSGKLLKITKVNAR